MKNAKVIGIAVLISLVLSIVVVAVVKVTVVDEKTGEPIPGQAIKKHLGKLKTA